MKKTKQPYLAPAIEVIEMESEGGIMAGSMPGYGDGGSTRSGRSSATRTTGGYSGGASLSDIEDMINDILTTKK